MGVAIGSLGNWENDHTGVDPAAYPKILGLIGYNPLTEPICRLEADTPSMAGTCVQAVLNALGLASWHTLKKS
jgi:hypothetical protein